MNAPTAEELTALAEQYAAGRLDAETWFAAAKAYALAAADEELADLRDRYGQENE